MAEYKRRSVFVVACMGLMLFGIVLTMLGAILPELIMRFGVSKASAGSLFLLLTFGILLGTLLFGPSVDRLGYRAPLVSACVLVAIGIELIAFTESLAMVRVGVALIGLGGGVLNVATNGVVADTAEGGKAAGLSLLGAFFGVGAVGVPFLLGALKNVASQQTVLAAVGGLAIVIGVSALLTSFPVPKQSKSFPIAQALKIVREEPLLILAFILFLQSGMEITVGGWTSTFAGEELQLSGRAALFFLSLYWLGMMLARLAMGSILKALTPRTAVWLSLLLAFIGALLLIITQTTLLAAAGVFMVGAGFAAVFPVVLSWLGERYQDLSGTAFSMALVIGLLGGMLMPYVAGLLGERWGMRASLVVVPVALALSAVLLAVANARRIIPHAQETS